MLLVLGFDGSILELRIKQTAFDSSIEDAPCAKREDAGRWRFDDGSANDGNDNNDDDDN